MLPRKIEKVTIVALGKSIYDWISTTYDNFEGLEGEVWTINSGAALYRHDVVFDMHTEEWIADLDDQTKGRCLRRREWLKTHDKPIVMPRAMAIYPTSVTYPLREVIERTGSAYFASGIAYLLAMAICCEVKQLKMFGCDFSYDRDTNTHDEQGRACAEYWVGRLVGSGCDVGVSNNTHFMDGFRRSKGEIYGYHEPVTMDFPVKGGKGIFVGPNYR